MTELEGTLARLLERVAALMDEKDRLAAETTRVNKELKELEGLAVEQLSLSGLDGVRAAGKSWSVRESFSVNVPSGSREDVVAAAREACPEMISVNTSSLKAWLVEERKRRGAGGGESLAAGTPFDGLISEYREMRLSHRTVG